MMLWKSGWFALLILVPAGALAQGGGYGDGGYGGDYGDGGSSPGGEEDESDYGKGDMLVDLGCDRQAPELVSYDRSCDIWVPADAPTIQAGLDAAVAGQRVCVSAGTYIEQVVLWEEDLELVGAGSGLTVIEAPPLTRGPVVTIANGGGLQGVTVQDGLSDYGAGVYAAGESVWIDDVESHENHCDARVTGACQGVGVWVGADAAQLTDVWVHDNSCSTTATCEGAGLALWETAAQVVGLVSGWNDCSASSSCRGVGVWSSAGEIIGRDWWVHDNGGTAARVDGGGVGVFDSVVTDLEDLVVEYNEGVFETSSSFGGGVALASPERCHRIARTRISWNLLSSSAAASVAYGGGLSLGAGDLDLRLTELSANIAEAYHAEGGGLRVDGSNLSLFENGVVSGNLASSEAAVEHAPDGGFGGGVAVETVLFMDNVDVVGNAVEGSQRGAGIAVLDEFLYMRNVDVAFNGPMRPHWMPRSVTTSASQMSTVGGTVRGVYGNHYPAQDPMDPRVIGHGVIADHDYSHWTVPYSNAPWTSLSPNWLSEDPLYVSMDVFDPVDWDLTLQPGSPMIDAGVPWILDPDGTASDIGAYGGYRAGGW